MWLYKPANTICGCVSEIKIANFLEITIRDPEPGLNPARLTTLALLELSHNN